MNFYKEDFDKGISLIKLGAGLAARADGKDSAYMTMQDVPKTEQGRSFLLDQAVEHIKEGRLELRNLSVR